MGLFDEIEIDGTLIGRDPGPLILQTKTFDCMMERYRISDAGRLEWREYETEDQSDKNAPRGSIQSVSGCMTHVATGKWIDLDWHGFVSLSGAGGHYAAKFTDGNLINVVPVDPPL